MIRKTQIHPEQFIPASPEQFIGGARAVAAVLKGKAKRMLETDGSIARILIDGAPGVGKTRLAEMFAGMLTDHPIQIESINGRSVSLDTVRRWQNESRFMVAFGKFTVKIINELDTMAAPVQDLLLTYIDEMPGNSAFVGTSNLDIKSLVERFQTRLQRFHVSNPETKHITRLLSRWKIPARFINEIAVASGGNVRAALLDAQSILDAGGVR